MFVFKRWTTQRKFLGLSLVKQRLSFEIRSPASLKGGVATFDTRNRGETTTDGRGEPTSVLAF